MSESLPMTKEQEARLAAVRRSAQRVLAAEDGLERAREGRRQAIAAAVESGVSLAAIGRELGVTRQRVKRIIEGK